MIKIYAMSILMVRVAWLGEVARIFGFKPFSLNSDSLFKAIVAST